VDGLPEDRLATTEEVGEYLQVPVGTLYQWRCRGTGPRSYKIGRHIRYQAADVYAWRDQRAAGGGGT
jgi:excisionase family DNA binding protein